MDLEDVAGQRLVPGGHAADGPGSEHAVAARRDEPAVQRSGQHPADRPDPETVLEFVDASDHQRRVGSSRAAKKADAVVNISFARLNRATSARKLLNSAIASSADCLVSAATVASVLLRQRRSVSGATPRSLATCSIALVSDEYEPRDSVNGLTAFALNSGVYLVPFAMVPSSPIELGEMRNKNQFISEPCGDGEEDDDADLAAASHDELEEDPFRSQGEFLHVVAVVDDEVVHEDHEHRDDAQ